MKIYFLFLSKRIRTFLPESGDTVPLPLEPNKPKDKPDSEDGPHPPGEPYGFLMIDKTEKKRKSQNRKSEVDSEHPEHDLNREDNEEFLASRAASPIDLTTFEFKSGGAF